MKKPGIGRYLATISSEQGHQTTQLSHSTVTGEGRQRGGCFRAWQAQDAWLRVSAQIHPGSTTGSHCPDPPFPGSGKEDRGCAVSPAGNWLSDPPKSSAKTSTLSRTSGRKKKEEEKDPECVHSKTWFIFGSKILQCFWRSGTVDYSSDFANAKINDRVGPVFERKMHEGAHHWTGEERQKK